MSDMQSIWTMVLFIICLAISIGILGTIILFFYNVYRHCMGRKKSSLEIYKLGKAILVASSIVVELGIILSIILFFNRVWKHINEKPIPSISMVNCRITEDIVYRQLDGGFILDFTSNGKTEGLKIGDFESDK